MSWYDLLQLNAESGSLIINVIMALPVNLVFLSMHTWQKVTKAVAAVCCSAWNHHRHNIPFLPCSMPRGPWCRCFFFFLVLPFSTL